MSSFRFQNLAGHPNKSTNVISFRDTYVMVDCTLDLMSILAYLPLSMTHNQQLSTLPNWKYPKENINLATFSYKESKIINYEVKQCQSGVCCVDASPEFALFDNKLIDPSHIDVVLITNYLNMFGLPYLTERLGFNGVIYVTEPTYHFGRIMMDEMIRLIERSPKPKRMHLWKRVHEQINLCFPRKHTMQLDPNKWLPIFSKEELDSCLAKLKVVNFGQAIDIFGLFEVSAHSSGFCIGSCNWTLKSTHEKIVYLSQTSLLTTHPKPFEPQPLQDADVMVLTNLTNSPFASADAMLGEFCSNTIQTIKNDGNVLVPCYPCGMVYDLIECIAGQLTAANLSQIPIYFISPMAEESLAYANILGEWLTAVKQTKVFIPEEPFIHSSLVRAGRLRHFKSVSDPAFNDVYKTPCVIFTSHPSLRFGDVVHFIQLWGQASKNLLVITEPDFPFQEAISPYLPLAMKRLYIPIDTNWNFKQANTLLRKDMRPSHLVLHNNYATKPPINFQGAHALSTTDLMIDLQNAIEDTNTAENSLAEIKPKTTAMHPYEFQESFDLSDSRATFERVIIDPLFANQIFQSEIRQGLCFATINGSLVAKDNKFTLQLIDPAVARSSNKDNVIPPARYYYGSINFPKLMELLTRSGINDASVEGGRSGKLIELRSIQAVIHIEESQTHIIAADNATRHRLRDLVACCLQKF